MARIKESAVPVEAALEMIVSMVVRTEDSGETLALEEVSTCAKLYNDLPIYFKRQLREGLKGFGMQKGLSQILSCNKIAAKVG